MLIEKDVALLRAAMRFFAEEMSPFDPKLLRHYFERPADANVKQCDVDRLQALLKDCELRYVACDCEGTTVLDHRLRRTPKPAVASARAKWQRLATVLLCRDL